jgi:hypothetical protein
MDLIVRVDSQVLNKHYGSIIEEIKSYYPVIAKATRCYNKTQSQFMDNMMTLSQPTELRSLRQILAELNRSKMALDEAYFGIEKKRIEKEQLNVELEALGIIDIEGYPERDIKLLELDKKLLILKINELESQIKNTVGYVEGALRRVSAYMHQYQNILKYLGKEEITEEDFEKDEERYHIMKAFEQALCAARSRGGLIDEGNQIYFYQIGINGGIAQAEIVEYLNYENEQIRSKSAVTHSLTWAWLHQMADKYSGCASKFAESKHIKLLDKTSLHMG